MKNLFISLLILIVLMQCTVKTAIVAYYQWNKAYIAANLCENRAKPKSCCAGKCYLEKKLKAEDKQEQKLPSLLKNGNEILFYQSNHSALLSNNWIFLFEILYPKYVFKCLHSPIFSLLRPPRF